MAAILLAGHGSSKNARVGESIKRHAETLRSKGLFTEVQECFWKEKPTFREALAKIKSSRIYIVPMFMSSGHFTQEILPKEFSLRGKYTIREGKEICYCFPVGTHPNITNVILHRAQTVVEGAKISCGETCLILVGHGTQKERDNSIVVIHQHAAKIRALGIYRQCAAAFLEEKPFLKDWKKIVTTPNVIIVPFFISNGTHVTKDIPVILGISEKFNKEFKIQRHRVWYTEAIGMGPKLVDVILDQVRYFDTIVR